MACQYVTAERLHNICTLFRRLGAHADCVDDGGLVSRAEGVRRWRRAGGLLPLKLETAYTRRL